MNKTRLNKLMNNPKGSKNYRLNRDMEIMYDNHIHATLDHLMIAHAHLEKYLEKKNRNGLLSNILNAAHAVKKYIEGDQD
jgi:hypothetical protein